MHILILPSLLYQTEYLPMAGVFQKHQADGLASSGHQVGVISVGLLPFKALLKPNPFKRLVATKECGVTILRQYNKAWIPQRFLRNTLFARVMQRLGMAAFREYLAICGKPEVLHVHDCLYAGVLAREIRRQYGIPYVVTEHSSMHQRGLYTAAERDLIAAIFNEASIVTTVGIDLRRHLLTHYGGLQTVMHARVIGNMLDGEFERSPLVRKTANGRFVFLNVAHLIELKAQINLILAMPTVLGESQNVELWIGGSGPMRDKLHQTINQLGLQGCVKLLGYLNRKQVREHMELCDAFVLSSQVETFGVVLIEAMARGKPVIATACGGPEDFVHDLSGYLVPTDDVGALASAMISMIKNCDDFVPETIRQNCIDRFGMAAFTKELLHLYQEALSVG